MDRSTRRKVDTKTEGGTQEEDGEEISYTEIDIDLPDIKEECLERSTLDNNSRLSNVKKGDVLIIGSRQNWPYSENSSDYDSDNNLEYFPEENEKMDPLLFGDSSEDGISIWDISQKKSLLPKTSRIRSRIFCFYCKTQVLNFARHIQRSHSSEAEVLRLLSLPPKTKERKDLVTLLRKRGDYLINREICTKPMKKSNLPYCPEKHLPCTHCLGFYSIKTLWKHVKICNKDSKSSKAQSEAQNLLVRHLDIDQNLRDRVFPSMRPDAISLVAKKDILICAFGAHYLKKHCEKHVIKVTSRKMRELAKLLMEIKKIDPTVKNLFHALNPKNFDLFVEATKIIAKYDDLNDCSFSSTYAVNVTMSLRKCCEIAIVYAVNKKDFYADGQSLEAENHLKAMILLLRTNLTFNAQGKINKKKLEIAPWTKAQTNIVNDFFEIHIANSRSPKKDECDKLIQKFPEILQNKSWLKIKAYVQKQYLQMEKCAPGSTQSFSKSDVLKRENALKDPLLIGDISEDGISNSDISQEKPLPPKTSKYIRLGAFCFYCKTQVLNFSRHIQRSHSSEAEVLRLSSLPPNTKERKDLLAFLRKKGNYLINREICTKPVKKSNLQHCPEKHLPCSHCLGFYSIKTLWKHVKTCNKDLNSSNARSEAQNFLVRHLDIDQNLRDRVFPSMRPDAISLVAKKDTLICAFGAHYLKKHCEKHVIKVTSRKMRELARLLMEIKKIDPTIKNLFHALNPKNFNLFVEATKIVTKYDSDDCSYNSTYAVNVAMSLRKCCEIAIVYAVNKKDFYADGESLEAENHLKAMILLLSTSLTFKAKGKINKKKRELTPWTKEQKNIVNDFFKIHIANSRVPKQKECDKLIQEFPEILQNKSWRKIKVYVQNQYLRREKDVTRTRTEL